METFDVSIKSKRFYVYILYSLHDQGFYIGFTSDLRIRLSEHAHGKVLSTKNRRPFLLIHYEYFINMTDAKTREEYLKSGYGRRTIQQSLKRTLAELTLQ